MHYNLVPPKLQVLACHGDLRLVNLEDVLLFHLDPEDSLLKTGHRNHPLVEILGLIGRYTILPCDHDILRDTKPYEKFVLHGPRVRDHSISVRDRLKIDLYARKRKLGQATCKSDELLGRTLLMRHRNFLFLFIERLIILCSCYLLLKNR